MTQIDKTSLKQLSAVKAFDCDILRYEFNAASMGGLRTTFYVIVPPAATTEPVPLLVWLSGLTCTDENFIIKAGAAAHAAKHRIAIACPDTSPRGAGAPDEDASWDFGTGASFYVNATTPGFEKYQMEAYVTEEFPAVVAAALVERVDVARRGISGHSMGGMGALSLALRHPDSFASVSAFAPIANPVDAPWGEKCYTGYLGAEREKWAAYDPTCVLKAHGAFDKFDIMIDQGGSDGFLSNQLKPQAFLDACKSVGQKVTYNLAEGYDHSYFFVQTFIEKHVAMHAKACWAASGK